MNKIEKFFVGIFALFTIVFFTVMIRVNLQSGYGDNAIFVELTENFIKEGRRTQLGAAMDELLFKNGLLTIKADQLKEFNFENTNYKEGDVLKFHLYLIIYFISLLAFVIPVYWVWSFLISISFVGFLFLIYLQLRKNVSFFYSALFIFLITVHPAWNFAIQGQIYPDRFFLILGIIMLLLLDNKKSIKLCLILSVLLAVSIVEKTLLMVTLIVLGYLILNWQFLNKKNKKFYLLLGISLILICIFVFKFFLANAYYSSFISISSFTNFFNNLKTNMLLRQNVEIFLLANGIFLFFRHLLCFQKYSESLFQEQ